MPISLFICHLYFGKIWNSLNKLDVEKIIELDLSDEEKKQFDHSIEAVQKLFEAAKKIDNSLN